MPTTLSRPNRYAAACVRCGGRILAGEGLLARTETGWAADHPEDCPERPAAAPAPVARANRDGIYRVANGDIFKVQEARQGTGRLYAKRLVVTVCTDRACGHPTLVDENGEHHHGHFEYAPGVVNVLTAEQRLDEHDARVFGRLYGLCVVCGADLTAEKSVGLGIGPVCRSKAFA